MSFEGKFLMVMLHYACIVANAEKMLKQSCNTAASSGDTLALDPQR